MAEIRNNLCIFIGALGLFIVALNTKEIGNVEIDSMLWPKLILILIMAISICSPIGAFIERRKRAASPVKSENRNSFKPTKETVSGIIPIIAVFIYVWMIDTLGYFISTLIVIPVLMYLLGEKRMLRLAGTPILFVLIVWFVFVKVALLMFPMGTGVFRDLNQLIMFG